jgi:hypothetical protein
VRALIDAVRARQRQRAADTQQDKPEKNAHEAHRG